MTTHLKDTPLVQGTSYDWAEGFKRSLPVAMGYLPAGIAFGVLAQVAGIPVWATVMLSVVLYAGAAQYACIPFLAQAYPLAVWQPILPPSTYVIFFMACPYYNPYLKTNWPKLTAYLR